MIHKRKSLFRTPFLELVEVIYKLPKNGVQKKWYGATRVNAEAAVVIVAITEDNKMIFVKQPRPMTGKELIEFPAGLMDKENETVLETADRELLEETGYKAENLQKFLNSENGLYVSPGLSDEKVHLVIGKNAKKIAEPLENESTLPILVPLEELKVWLKKKIEKEEIEYKAAIMSLSIKDLIKKEEL